MESERVSEVNKIITGIAQKSAYKFKDLEVDDISQELWLHILELEASYGKSLDNSLIACICYRRIVDMQRDGMKHNHYSIRFYNEDPNLMTPDDYLSNIMIKDLLRMFPKDSLERKFLVYWGSRVNLCDYDDSLIIEGKYVDGYTENSLAKSLGFKDSSNRRYKRFREKMRKFILQYFDLNSD